MQTIWRGALAGVAVAAGLPIAGCGLQPADSFVPDAAPGSIRPIDELPARASLTVTSKNFTEALILAKMAVLATRVAGFRVTDMSNVPGSVAVRELMLNGEADIVWDYTGTAWLTYLGHRKGVAGQRRQYEAVRDADEENGLTWLEPSRLDNTYAFAVRADAVPALGGIARLSQLNELPVRERTFCVDAEFNSRPDGFKPMLQEYGLVLGAADGVPTANVTILDIGAVYEATARGVCNFGEVFSTDGRIVSLGLKVLDDDRRFFPAYNAAPVVRTSTLRKYPQLERILQMIASRLTNSQQQQLNHRVDVDGQDPARVAFDWMIKQGLITRP